MVNVAVMFKRVTAVRFRGIRPFSLCVGIGICLNTTGRGHPVIGQARKSQCHFNPQVSFLDPFHVFTQVACGSVVPFGSHIQRPILQRLCK